jgi:transposase InsO family protein
MCHFFNVSRSGYYGFLKRGTLPGKEALLVKRVQECHSSGKYMRTYGCRRVQLWIARNYGEHYNYKTVWRIMHKYGMLSLIRRKRFFCCGEQLRTYPNLLNRNFNAIRPNQKWATDISYIQTKQGVLYLSVIRDLFDRSIVAYKTSANQSTKLVLDTIRAAMKKEKVTAELQLHSDQGFQYASQSYFTLTQQYGITPSMSRRGNPYDNAVAENFFGILKVECIRPARPKTLQEADDLIHEYIYFYNYERIQTKTKLTPLEKRSQLA